MESIVTEVLSKNTVTCPNCGSKQHVDMLESADSYAYQCNHCNEIIEKRDESHCAYCSYGEVKCPSEQIKWN